MNDLQDAWLDGRGSGRRGSELWGLERRIIRPAIIIPNSVQSAPAIYAPNWIGSSLPAGAFDLSVGWKPRITAPGLSANAGQKVFLDNAYGCARAGCFGPDNRGDLTVTAQCFWQLGDSDDNVMAEGSAWRAELSKHSAVITYLIEPAEVLTGLIAKNNYRVCGEFALSGSGAVDHKLEEQRVMDGSCVFKVTSIGSA